MPTAPVAVAGLVMSGGPSVMVKTTPWLPVPAPLLDVTVALKTPVAVGAPEMSPVFGVHGEPGRQARRAIGERRVDRGDLVGHRDEALPVAVAGAGDRGRQDGDREGDDELSRSAGVRRRNGDGE
jgi:hypothetical protein